MGQEKVGTLPSNTFVAKALAEARSIYEKHQLEGCTEKDTDCACVFKAAGAEIISSPEVVALGLSLVGAHISKRIALSALSLNL